MPVDTDVVVVGAGVIGAAAAHAVARAGRDVVVLERFEPGHRRGSSHGASRIFRLSYDDPGFVRMMQAALPLWRDLEADCGTTILTATGGVDIGEPALANANALAACGVAHDVMESRDAAERFPMFSFPPGVPVVFQADAGIVHADAAWAGFLDQARRHGATVLHRTPATSLEARGDGVIVRTEGDPVRARAAVVTVGSWARPLLSTAGMDIPVYPTRETAAYFRVPEPWPPVLVQWESTPYYALPNPGNGIKAAQHHAGPRTEPDVEEDPSEEAVARLRAWVAERFVGADPEPLAAETCLYTNTDDERFILERRGPVVIGSACSGHAFKFAPLIGQRLATLAVEGG